MREIDEAQALIIDANITESRYLVQIVLDDTFRYSTEAPITLEYDYWQSGDIDLLNVGVNAASLRIKNTDWQLTAAALSGKYMFGPVTIRYLASSIATPILLFSGFVSEIPGVGEWLTINCKCNLRRRYPSIIARPPLANHLPAQGQVISWKGKTYRIDS